jgi:hypothetical protein
MLNGRRPLTWINDPLNQTIVAVAIVAAIAMNFVVAHGWVW